MIHRVTALLVLLLTTGITEAHSPVADGDLSDWCLDTTIQVDDRAATLECGFGTEVVWWDAPADAVVNDLALMAFTSDAVEMHWGLKLYNDPDPNLLPMIELAIDAGPGGSNLWWDPMANVKIPGHCSVDTSRLCTTDDDCHFCANTTTYTGTPNERPRVCGSTDGLDRCNDLDPNDVCNRTQTCEGLAAGAHVPAVGGDAGPGLAADYLLVVDFGRWLIGFCDAAMLLRNDNGSWVEIPRPVPDPFCSPHLETWRFPIMINPGTGQPGVPGVLELAIPWEAFTCAGCVPLGPGDDFRWTVRMSRGKPNFDYIPDGPIEDVISEAVPGTWTTTADACATPGEAATLCEIADGSTDAFVSTAPQDSGGETVGLIMQRNDSANPNPSITMIWDPSCAGGDYDYAIYEGEIDSWYSHVEPSTGAICSTAGATEATFDAGAGDRYYLVVPRDNADEGSYGLLGGAAERPVSSEACLSQDLGGCP